MCALKKTLVFVRSPDSINGKQSESDWAIRYASQSTSCFRSMEGRGVIWLAVELRYHHPFTRRSWTVPVPVPVMSRDPFFQSLDLSKAVFNSILSLHQWTSIETKTHLDTDSEQLFYITMMPWMHLFLRMRIVNSKTDLSSWRILAFFYKIELRPFFILSFQRMFDV